VPGSNYDFGETEDYDIVLTNNAGIACSTGLTLTAPSGIIDDGSGADTLYANLLDCHWLIQPTMLMK
jgi:hypothetical protein